MKKAACRRPFRLRQVDALLANVPVAVFAPEVGAGLADEPAARVSLTVSTVPAAPAVAELVIAGVGISRSVVLAIGVRIELGAIAGIGDHLLRHHGACERGGKDHGSSAKKSKFRHAFLRCRNVVTYNS